MGEGVGDGALHETVDGGLDGGVGGEEIVEGLESAKEAALFFRPHARLGGVPLFVAERDAERPIEQVAHVSENLDWSAASAGKAGEVVGGCFKGARRAVSEGGDCVAEELAGRIGVG